MKRVTCGFYVALLSSVLGGFGCGEAISEESVSEVQEAIDINTWSGLVGMASTGSYALKANINAAGRTWTPKSFSGTFDGGNFTISNLTINGGSFFSSLNNATIRRVKLIDVTITGGSTPGVGGLATSATNTRIENTVAHVNINLSGGGDAVGGLLGRMTGGSIYRSYAKGQVRGNVFFAGGLVGNATRSPVGRATITQSYAQVTVAPGTPVGLQTVSGGVVGYAYEADVHDAYAVGDVTGRGAVGGIIGKIVCAPGATEQFGLYKTIYRGDVIDQDWTPSGGWKGSVGTFQNCAFRMVQNFYDRSLDGSTYQAVHDSIRGYTTTELTSPESVIGGVYCEPDIVPGRCGDMSWKSPPWTAGTSTAHHWLLNMPGPNVQQPLW
jgi:hypothetical protein